MYVTKIVTFVKNLCLLYRRSDRDPYAIFCQMKELFFDQHLISTSTLSQCILEEMDGDFWVARYKRYLRTFNWLNQWIDREYNQYERRSGR